MTFCVLVFCVAVLAYEYIKCFLSANKELGEGEIDRGGERMKREIERGRERGGVEGGIEGSVDNNGVMTSSVLYCCVIALVLKVGYSLYAKDELGEKERVEEREREERKRCGRWIEITMTRRHFVFYCSVLLYLHMKRMFIFCLI